MFLDVFLEKIYQYFNLWSNTRRTKIIRWVIYKPISFILHFRNGCIKLFIWDKYPLAPDSDKMCITMNQIDHNGAKVFGVKYIGKVRYYIMRYKNGRTEIRNTYSYDRCIHEYNIFWDNLLNALYSLEADSIEAGDNSFRVTNVNGIRR